MYILLVRIGCTSIYLLYVMHSLEESRRQKQKSRPFDDHTISHTKQQAMTSLEKKTKQSRQNKTIKQQRPGNKITNKGSWTKCKSQRIRQIQTSPSTFE